MRLLIIAVLASILFGCDDEYVSRYPNGKVHVMSGYNDGDYVGEYTEYWENGNIKRKGTHRSGRLWWDSYEIGEWKEYYENGQIKEITNYDNTFFFKGPYKDGKSIEFCPPPFPDGQIKEEVEYSDPWIFGHSKIDKQIENRCLVDGEELTTWLKSLKDGWTEYPSSMNINFGSSGMTLLVALNKDAKPITSKIVVTKELLAEAQKMHNEIHVLMGKIRSVDSLDDYRDINFAQFAVINNEKLSEDGLKTIQRFFDMIVDHKYMSLQNKYASINVPSQSNIKRGVITSVDCGDLCYATIMDANNVESTFTGDVSEYGINIGDQVEISYSKERFFFQPANDTIERDIIKKIKKIGG